MAILKSANIQGTGHLTLPVGTSAQRPSATVTSFTSTGAFSYSVPTGVTSVDVLIVAGGGGGGQDVGGGGGAGGMVEAFGYPVTPGGTVPGSVGAGGAGAGASANGTSGGNSTFGALTAFGGGGGGG